MISLATDVHANLETYESFARLFLLEPDAATLEAWAGDTRFAQAFPTTAQEQRVEFTRLFTLSVFPYASVYLDSEAFLNTQTTARVEEQYAQSHFEPDPSLPIGAADHFGLELAFVSHLLKSGDAVGAQQFLWSEVLPWAGIFLHAVEKNAHTAFYRAAASAARVWLLSEEKGPDGDSARITLPEFAIQEDDLDSVVEGLIVPAKAGMFLSKQDISSLAHTLDVPLGFGDRALMLKSLFRAAGEYDRIQELLRLLQLQASGWIDAYTADARDFPQYAAIARDWLVLANVTLERLKRMEEHYHLARK